MTPRDPGRACRQSLHASWPLPMKLGTGEHRVEVPGTPPLHTLWLPGAGRASGGCAEGWEGGLSPLLWGLLLWVARAQRAQPWVTGSKSPSSPTKKVIDAGSQSGAEAGSPDPPMTRAMAGHPPPSTKSQGVERGVYCVQRPIVQSKDCTDTGGARESQRPEPGGRWGGRRGGMLAPPPDQ